MAIGEEFKRKLKCQELEIAKQNDVIAILQRVIETLRKQHSDKLCPVKPIEDLCCLRLKNVAQIFNETRDDCLVLVRHIIDIAKIGIPEKSIYEAYRDPIIDPDDIIVCVRPRSHGQTLYQARKKLRKKYGYNLQVNITKNKHEILEAVREMGEQSKYRTGFQFAYVNFNGVMFLKVGEKFEEFNSVEEAREKLRLVPPRGYDITGITIDVSSNESEDEEDEYIDINNMPFRQHTRLNDECLKRVSSGGNTLYEPGFVLQNSYNHYDPVALSATTHFDTGSEYLPMKRSVSCSVCLLCESNTRMRGYDTKNVFGGGMKKGASCSMCVWDVDDNKWSEEETSPLSADEASIISSDELAQKSCDEESDTDSEFYRRRSFVYGLERDENEEVDNLIYKSGKRENVYPAHLEELSINANYMENMTISRTSPDGGEYIDDFDESCTLKRTLKIDRNNNNNNNNGRTSTPEHCNSRLSDTLCETDEEEEIVSYHHHHDDISNRKLNEKQMKKTKTKRRVSLDRKATEELDEIFGKIHRQQSTVYESDTDSVHNFTFRPIPKSFSLTRMKKSNSNKKSNIKKCWSVEELCPKLSGGHEVTNEGGLLRSRSTCELSKFGMSQDSFDSQSSDVLKKLEDRQIYEKWLDYLERIGGAATLASNKSLRYIWQQIMMYHDDLQQPLEEFLKSNLEKSQQLYSSYQELEEMLEQKTEQQEKETAKIYNDVELAIQQEREQLQETFAEREEFARKESHKVISAKEQEIETLLLLNTSLNDTIKHLESTNEDLRVSKEKMDEQLADLTGAHTTLRKEHDTMIEINNTLMEKLNVYELVLKDQEEAVTKVNKQRLETDEKLRETKHMNIGLTEENDFLKSNVTNLNAEIEDLKAKNKLLSEQRPSSCSIASHGHFLCNSDDETDGGDFFENSYEDDVTRPMTSPILPVHISPALNSTFNNKHKNQNNNRHISNTSLMEEVTPFLNGHSPPVRSSPHRTPVSLPKRPQSSISIPSGRTPVSARKNLNSMLTRNTLPSQIRLATNRQTDYKVIFTGDCNVGKTSLIRRICQGKFRAQREETMEPDCSTKELECNGQTIKLKLWDTVGQERFNSIPPSYFRKSDIVILMYDIAEEVSFINAKTWIRTIHDYTNEDIFIVLVGNKSDMHHKRMVSEKKGQELATNNDAIFIETSAKSGENIAKLCQMMASTLVAREETVFIRKDFETSLCSLSYSMSQQPSRFNSSCCA